METKANRARGGLAQLGEHLPCKQGVESSNLLVSTVKIMDLHKSVQIIVMMCSLKTEYRNQS